MRQRFIGLVGIGLVLSLAFHSSGDGSSFESWVYNIHQTLSLGSSNETPQKDYYLNVGTTQGIKVGSVLQIIRRVPSYDLVSEQMYQNISFPIAWVKVIHVETHASIARLEKWLPAAETPAVSPKAIMLGDLVRLL